MLQVNVAHTIEYKLNLFEFVPKIENKLRRNEDGVVNGASSDPGNLPARSASPTPIKSAILDFPSPHKGFQDNRAGVETSHTTTKCYLSLFPNLERFT